MTVLLHKRICRLHSDMQAAENMVKSLWFFLDAESQLADEFQSAERRAAVILLLHLGQFVVGHQAGVVLQVVIALLAIGPSLFHAALRPHFVYILCHFFNESAELFGQPHVACVYRLRCVVFFHVVHQLKFHIFLP